VVEFDSGVGFYDWVVVVEDGDFVEAQFSLGRKNEGDEGEDAKTGK